MPTGKQVSTLVVEPMFTVLVNVVVTKENAVTVDETVAVVIVVIANRFWMT